MKYIFLLCSTDEHHKYTSTKLATVFSSKNKLIKYCSNFLKEEDLQSLRDIGQTQGRYLNYIIYTEKLNPDYELL